MPTDSFPKAGSDLRVCFFFSLASSLFDKSLLTLCNFLLLLLLLCEMQRRERSSLLHSGSHRLISDFHPDVPETIIPSPRLENNFFCFNATKSFQLRLNAAALGRLCLFPGFLPYFFFPPPFFPSLNNLMDFFFFVCVNTCAFSGFKILFQVKPSAVSSSLNRSDSVAMLSRGGSLRREIKRHQLFFSLSLFFLPSHCISCCCIITPLFLFSSNIQRKQRAESPPLRPLTRPELKTPPLTF